MTSVPRGSALTKKNKHTASFTSLSNLLLIYQVSQCRVHRKCSMALQIVILQFCKIWYSDQIFCCGLWRTGQEASFTRVWLCQQCYWSKVKVNFWCWTHAVCLLSWAKRQRVGDDRKGCDWTIGEKSKRRWLPHEVSKLWQIHILNIMIQCDTSSFSCCHYNFANKY